MPIAHILTRKSEGLNANMQTAESINVTSSKGVRYMLGLNLHEWEHVMLLSLIFAGIAAVVVAFSTIMVVKLQRLEAKATEETFLQYKEDAGKEIAAAGVKAAEANSRAAEANKIAETERLERLKLELKLAPREISPAHSAQLIAQLKTLKGMDVDIVSYDSMGADVAALSQQIASILINAHVNAKIFTPIGGGVVHGILVRTEMGSPKNIEDAIALIVTSFQGIGLSADRWNSYPVGERISGAYNGPGPSSAKLRILVGGKS